MCASSSPWISSQAGGSRGWGAFGAAELGMSSPPGRAGAAADGCPASVSFPPVAPTGFQAPLPRQYTCVTWALSRVRPPAAVPFRSIGCHPALTRLRACWPARVGRPHRAERPRVLRFPHEPHAEHMMNGSADEALQRVCPRSAMVLASSSIDVPVHFWRRLYGGRRLAFSQSRQIVHLQAPARNCQLCCPRVRACVSSAGGGTRGRPRGAGGKHSSAAATARTTWGDRLV